ncbi:MAG TPA: ZIP family metal transporter [Candidatus Paceibacterota bacterium]|nr:ZIP family metal transporter [Candidatus Paceibacterota bacterium]
MIIFLIAIAAFIATLLGGLFALKFRDKLHLILGFSAGAVIAVAFFDLLPEAINLGNSYNVSTITGIVALGFIVYTILDRFVILHSHHDEHNHSGDLASPRRGVLGAGSLSIHSFLDGVAIGLAFQISAAVGAVVAIAVLVHDFSDGINTVNLISKNGGSRKDAFRWLVVDALAPVLGVTSTLLFSLPESALGIVLATFCGFFLYIGATDLLPESHHGHPTYWTTLMTVVGMTVLYLAIKLIG